MARGHRHFYWFGCVGVLLVAFCACAPPSADPSTSPLAADAGDGGTLDGGVQTAGDGAVTLPGDGGPSVPEAGAPGGLDAATPGGLDAATPDSAAPSPMDAGFADASVADAGANAAFPPITAVPACVIRDGSLVSPVPEARTHRWRWLLMPPGSEATMLNPGLPVTPFRVDLYGLYQVANETTDAQGITTVHQCSILHKTQAQLAIQMFRDDPRTDLDLHLVRQGQDGQFVRESKDDCYYSNCAPAVPGLLWDPAAPPRSGANPVLQRDVKDEPGVETLEVQLPRRQTYRVMVKHFSDHGFGPTAVTVRIAVGGELHAEFRIEGLAGAAWWDVADIEWMLEDQQICLQELPAGARHCLELPVCSLPGGCVECGPSLPGCGPGVQCLMAVQQCRAGGMNCEGDAQCSAPSRCQPATRSCVIPACQDDSECMAMDPRRRCSGESLECVLVPAQCVEADEPNNHPGAATPLAPSGQAQGYAVSSKLCRGDADYFSLPGIAGKHLRVRILARAGVLPEGTAQLIAGDGVTVLQERALPSTWPMLEAILDEDADVYVRVAQALDSSSEEAPYAVEASLQDLDACSFDPAGAEPIEEAVRSVLLPGVSADTLCAAADVDYHLLNVEPGMVVNVTVDGDPAHGLHVSLLSASGDTLQSSPDVVPPVTLTRHVQNGDDPLLIRVLGVQTGPPLSGPLPYTTNVQVSLSTACRDGLREPNNTQVEATTVAPQRITAVACHVRDEDWYTLTLEQAGDLRATLVASPGDLDVFLYAQDGAVVAEAVGTGALDALQVTTLPAGPYWLRVRPYSRTSGVYPVSYALEIVAPTAVAPSSSSSNPAGGSGSGGSSSSGMGTSGTASSSSSSTGGAGDSSNG